jgi:polyhydroxybutyrate depolymerase
VLKDKVVAAAFGSTLVFAPCPASAQAQRMAVAGASREYLVHLPPAAAGKPDALVIVLHGGSGRPAAIAAHTRFNRLADREGFIVAYPAARNGRWQDGRPGAERGDDVAFLHALADTLRLRHGIPGARVFVAGISNGAMMSYRLACEAPAALGAIGAVAGAMPAGLQGKCTGAAPMPVIAIHGTEDRLVPFDGSAVLLSVPATLAVWAARANCRAPSPAVTTDRVRDGTVVEHVTYTSCDVPVELHTIRGGGHTWPGGPRVRVVRLGRTSRELDATEALWRFFDRIPARAARQGRSIGSPTPFPHSVHEPS